ncbi:M20/M25/M40 family metallo-hydrolase [Nitrosophilus kaiyonis]|uniref:M20/M25/M40 family metallo-hydrolase n=1 Tax=Nitrosophilus kaiyonis TaxID=2930200 RepID=UPI002492F136|nr:M20/M25/M40 family metallo-hydrolase [Nitrosophilus kaiyonis]
MEILDIFKKITSIPHCSKNTKKLQNFIEDFAKKYKFNVEVDKSGNILCYKEKRKICLQSHYDMVCVGKAPDIEIIKKDDFLMAKDSSLGADNGIGVALMLHLISKNIKAEYLFTNDEEIGLIGAKNLELSIKSKYMVNLDSEELGSIFIGCAGGVDIFASKKSDLEKIKFYQFYKIETINFPGGHSGVDIDKDIPNAIKELSKYLSNLRDFQLILLKGGERINSIPSKAYAIIATNENLKNCENFIISKIDKLYELGIKNADKYINFIAGFAHGVRGCDFDLKIPKTSINLAIADINIKEIKISFSARSMKNELLNEIENETKNLLNSFGFDVISKGKYPAWNPQIKNLAKIVKNIYEKYINNVKYKAIHAGLESAIIGEKFPNLEIVSIGPNIYNPHSTRERVEIKSIEIFQEVVEELVNSF